MRLEATVPDSRGNAVVQLADELGLSRSQLVDEALALFLKAVLEVRRGRRLVTMDPRSTAPACELATPTLSALEWARASETIVLGDDALVRAQALADEAPPPNSRLRSAARRAPA